VDPAEKERKTPLAAHFVGGPLKARAELELSQTEAGESDIVGRQDLALREWRFGRPRVPRQAPREEQDHDQRNAILCHGHSPAPSRRAADALRYSPTLEDVPDHNMAWKSDPPNSRPSHAQNRRLDRPGQSDEFCPKPIPLRAKAQNISQAQSFGR